MAKHSRVYRTANFAGHGPRTPPLVTAEPAADKAVDLTELLGHFSDSIALLSVTHVSLASKELAGTGDEEVALRHVLKGLKSVYNGFDVSLSLVTPSPQNATTD